MSKLSFIRVLNSPFKRFKLRFYFGKVAIGVPFFFPRKWKKDKEKPGYYKVVDKKIGFDLCGLGWKTKWGADDFRFEYSPVFSFVFFKWQFVISFIAPYEDHYWESWLYYDKCTDKTKSKIERLQQCQENFSQIWTRYDKDNKKEVVDYYYKIVKKKYLKYLK